ncbi:MAG: hypothetical protein H7A44_12145 [Opitutaceae bacterium]|nr:hypothetical protein [Cephaloticoccus sp.]MCP5531179.1 hypothetical protein [Opitutaceae bacterium]
MHPFSSLRFGRLNLELLAATLGLALLASSGYATSGDDVPLIIQVRSAVDQPFEGWGKAEIKEHGKIYALVSIEEMPGEEKLVKPVNEAEFLKALHGELARQGFKRTSAKLKPDIAITVNYGRGYQPNPYQDDMSFHAAGDPPIYSLAGVVPTQLMRRYEPRFEEKMQNATFEKLYIHIMAWEYPQEPRPAKFKPKLLWKTTVLTDSPEDRDFNQFIPKMLAAAGGYFDRKTEKEEAEIRDDMPEGRVILRDMKVLKDDQADLELESERKMK